MFIMENQTSNYVQFIQEHEETEYDEIDGFTREYMVFETKTILFGWVSHTVLCVIGEHASYFIPNSTIFRVTRKYHPMNVNGSKTIVAHILANLRHRLGVEVKTRKH